MDNLTDNSESETSNANDNDDYVSPNKEDKDSSKPQVSESLQGSQQNIKLEYSVLSSKDIVSRHMSKFINDVKAVTGDLSPCVESILSKPLLYQEDKSKKKIGKKKMASRQKSSYSSKLFPDIEKTDFVDKQRPSVESILKTPGFEECLTALSEDDQNMSESLEDLIQTINNRIKGTILESEEGGIEANESDANDATEEEEDIYSVQNIVKGEFAQEFKSLYGFIQRTVKKGFKDVFQGPDLEDSTKLGRMCLEIFRKMKRGTINDFADIAGPKYVKTLVENDPVSRPFISNEDENRTAHWINFNSFYDCLSQLHKEQGFAETINRVILVGKFKEDLQLQVERKFQDIVAAINEDLIDESSRLTGALILYPNMLLHIVEGSNQAIDEFITKTAEITKDELLEKAKITFKYDNISSRHFKYWKSTPVKTKRFVKKDDKSEKSDVDFLRKLKAFERRVFKIGAFAHELPSEQFEEKMQSLVEIQLLPPEHKIILILEKDYCLTPGTYVNLYMGQKFIEDLDEFDRPSYFVGPL